MNQAVLTVELPAEVYERLRRAAQGMKQPVELALVQIVLAATPSLDKVPVPYRADLEALEDRTDDHLWQVAERRLAATKQRRLTNLLDKNQRGRLTDREHQALTALRTEADRLTLQRAYAYLLLKYRGHRVPNLADMT
jgi:hypothetical protein